VSWEQLGDILREQRAEAEFYRSQPPQACPNDGEPLIPAPPGAEGGVQLFCRFDGWAYPRDYDAEMHQGM
jgi:hypothetical protein